MYIHRQKAMESRKKWERRQFGHNALLVKVSQNGFSRKTENGPVQKQSRHNHNVIFQESVKKTK